MKKTFYGVLIAAAVFFGSCVNENENPSRFKAGEVVNVKFTAGLQASPKQGATRAVGNVGDEDTGLSGLVNLENQASASGNVLYSLRYIVRVVDAQTGNPAFETVVTKDIDGSDPGDLRTLTFSAFLTTGVEYRTEIWADITDKGSPDVDRYYNTSAFPVIELTNDALITVNEEAKDAYFVTDTRVSDGENVNLTLRRPFGKIRFLARDYAALNDAATSGQTPGNSEQDKMTTDSKYLQLPFPTQVPATTPTSVYTKFSVSTGDVDPLSQTSIPATVFKNTTNSAENGELATFWDYVLAPSAAQVAANAAANPQILFSVAYKAKQGTANAVDSVRYYYDKRIVVERNRLTTVRDDLFFFNRTKFTVTIDDDFDGEDIPLRAVARFVSGDTAYISIQRDTADVATFVSPRAVAGITLVNTSTEILIGSAAGRPVTLKFDPATNGIVRRTTGDTTLINTVAELAFVRQYPANKYKLEADIDLKVGGTAGTPADSLEWTPIGTFSGIFDGAGHTVRSLKISSGNSNAGFFGSDGGGTVKNLGVSGNVSGNTYVGGISGGTSGIIIACSFDGTVTANTQAGGIIGTAYSNIGITACHTSGTVTGNTEVGGLIGHLLNTTRVTACYSTATVTGSGGSFWGNGGNATTVADCFTNGTAQTGVTVFSGTNWPAWSLCAPDRSDGGNTDKYWYSLGSYSATNPVYPKLWWEK